ncbi:MAG: hypothetical protein GH151_02315 [Bacteroidetes bacterium]|nr:hypothetical protein [Bacteroidota bacterium]
MGILVCRKKYLWIRINELVNNMNSFLFKTALDKTKNNVTKNVEYDEIDPVKCRYVRLTITGAPPQVPVGIIEFTVFGNPVEP